MNRASLYGHAGGDALLTICLWKAGYAHTDPGFSFFHPTVRMFDPGPEDSPGLLYAMTEALAGRCDPSCQVFLAAFTHPSSDCASVYGFAFTLARPDQSLLSLLPTASDSFTR